MHITDLRLNNFRNYKSEKISFNKGINIIYGGNAQGKTNILEAVYLCSCGRSHRTARDTELVRIGCDGYSIKLGIKSADTNPVVEISSRKNEKKIIRVNGIPVRKLGELMGNARVVMFSPEDLSIVKGSPSERRRFIDITLSQIKPSYFYNLQKYRKILSQRNNLLKEILEKGKGYDTLVVWNESLAEMGSRIIIEREKFIGKMMTKAKKKHNIITREKEKLEIGYEPSFSINELCEIENVRNNFIKKMERNAKRDIRYGTTMYGPHRDDLRIMLDGMDLREYGSQGQQRTVVLSLKMAEMNIIHEETGEMPVMLLDDVMSELDSERRDYLLKNIKGIQAVITSTDRDIAEECENDEIKYIEICNGEVKGD